MNSQKIIKYIFEIDYEEIWEHELNDIWAKTEKELLRKCYWQSLDLRGRDEWFILHKGIWWNSVM